MCPDRSMLTEYIDHSANKELQEIITSHLEVCDTCKAEVARQRNVVHSISSINEDPVLQAAAERVFTKVTQKVSFRRQRKFTATVRIPLPVVLAAAALLMFLGIGFISKSINPQNYTNQILAANVQEKNLEDVLNYLMSSGDIELNINLPQDSAFNVVGTPQPELLRTSDYRR